MLDTLAATLREPLFWLFPVASGAISMGAFALFAGPLTWLAWRDPPRLRKYRIQNRRVGAKAVVWPSVRRWLVNNLLMFVVVALAWPLLRHSGLHAGALPPWWVIALQVVFFIYLDDLLFYGLHRLLHTRWLFKHIHHVHHRVHTPWAVTGHNTHPVEYLLTGAVALVGPVLVEAHVVVLWIWIAWRQWEAAEGHCGYDFPWTPTHLLPFNDGAVHHDFHHARVHGNYAGFLTHVDRLLGTFSKGYAQDMARRRAAPSPEGDP